MPFPRRARAGLAVAACAAIGAAGGIAAAPAHKARSSASGPSRIGPPMEGRGGRAVHAVEVVLNRAGDAFITQTVDSGKLKSVSGSDITITEGTSTVTYQDETITVPDGAKIVRNGATAALGDLQVGDRVDVRRSSDGTSVFAADASWRPDRRRRHGPPPG